VTILDIQGDQVRIGINAPKNIAIHRKEVYLEICEENRKAADFGNIPLENLFTNVIDENENRKVVSK